MYVYGNSAIGYVQVKREGNVCKVLGDVVPEHKVKSTCYEVEAKIDLENQKINYAQCNGCVALYRGCKHALAFIAWLHRNTEEQCYWEKAVFLK